MRDASNYHAMRLQRCTSVEKSDELKYETIRHDHPVYSVATKSVSWCRAGATPE